MILTLRIGESSGLCVARMRSPHHGIAILLCTVLFGGCAAFQMDRPSEAPRIDVPAAWLESGKGNNGRISTGWVGTRWMRIARPANATCVPI